MQFECNPSQTTLQVKLYKSQTGNLPRWMFNAPWVLNESGMRVVARKNSDPSRSTHQKIYEKHQEAVFSFQAKSKLHQSELFSRLFVKLQVDYNIYCLLLFYLCIYFRIIIYIQAYSVHMALYGLISRYPKRTAWTAAISSLWEAILEPFGLHDLDSYMAADQDAVNEIR